MKFVIEHYCVLSIVTSYDIISDGIGIEIMIIHIHINIFYGKKTVCLVFIPVFNITQEENML